jgi:hypothetical protein
MELTSVGQLEVVILLQYPDTGNLAEVGNSGMHLMEESSIGGKEKGCRCSHWARSRLLILYDYQPHLHAWGATMGWFVPIFP